MTSIRQAGTSDAAAITAICGQGIADRGATFETAPRAVSELVARSFPFNAASRALCRAGGFREVGVSE